MRTRNHGRRGSALIEFTLVGIPIIFVLISIFEISRGMWLYVTLAHAVREGSRFAIVHGKTCTEGANDCGSTVGGIAARIQNAGVGLLPDQLTVTISSSTRSYGPVTLTTLLANTTPFPAFAKGTIPQDPGGDPEMDAPITISATYPFQSAICMFWPGATPVPVFAQVNLPALSRARVEF